MNQENKVSFPAYLFLFLTTAIAGAVLSFIYLWINRVSTSVYFCIIAAVALGLGIGFCTRLIITFFKMNKITPVVIIVVIACLGFTYFKWALYLATEAGSENCLSYATWYNFYFADDFLDEDKNLLSDAELTKIITDMREMTAYDYINAYGQRELWGLDEWDNDDLKILKENSFYEHMEHHEFLSSGSVYEAVAAIKNEYEYSFFIHYLNFSEFGEPPTVIKYMSNPADMFEVIKRIGAEGRWAYNDNLINGASLWVVWLIEFIILMFIPMAIAIGAVQLLGKEEEYPQIMNINQFKEPDTPGAVTAEQIDEMGRPLAQTNYYGEVNTYNPQQEEEKSEV
jgi:hypothetical protein